MSEKKVFKEHRFLNINVSLVHYFFVINAHERHENELLFRKLLNTKISGQKLSECIKLSYTPLHQSQLN